MVTVPPAGATEIEEDEPNDGPDEANAIRTGYGASLAGSCVASPDFGSIFYSDHRAVELSYSLKDINGSPAQTLISLYTPSGVEFRRIEAFGNGSTKFSLYEGADYTVGVHCTGNVDRWKLWIDTSSTNGATVGRDEQEHNDISDLASDLRPAGETVGYLNVNSDPLDIWRVPSSVAGDITVNLTTGRFPEASLWSVGATGGPLALYGSSITLRGVVGGVTFFAVVAAVSYGTYNLTWSNASPPEAIYEGAGEKEPNNGIATANAYAASSYLDLAGRADLRDDPVDYYRFSFPVPTLAAIAIDDGASCLPSFCARITLLELDGSPALDPDGEPLDGTFGYSFAAGGGSSFVVRVDAGASNVFYRITVDAPSYFLEEDAEVELNEANASGAVSAFATGSGDHPELYSVNIGEGGDGTVYGESLLLLIESKAPVDLRVRVLAGTRLKGEDPDLLRFIVTRNTTFVLPALGLTLEQLTAVVEGPNADDGGRGFYPDFGHLYFLDGLAVGLLRAVTNETATGNYGYKQELIAVWAANGYTRDDLTSFGATTAEVDQTAPLLNAAGVRTSINPAAPPTSPPPNFSYLFPAVILVLILFAVIAALADRRARRQRAARAAASPNPWAQGGGGWYAPGSPWGYPAQPPDYGGPPGGVLGYGPQPAYYPTYSAYSVYPQPAGAPPTPYAAVAPDPYPALAQPEPSPYAVTAPAPARRLCPACQREAVPNATYCVYCGEFFPSA